MQPDPLHSCASPFRGVDWRSRLHSSNLATEGGALNEQIGSTPQAGGYRREPRLRSEAEIYLEGENKLERMLGCGVIAPRLQAVYERSARELGIARASLAARVIRMAGSAG